MGGLGRVCLCVLGGRDRGASAGGREKGAGGADGHGRGAGSQMRRYQLYGGPRKAYGRGRVSALSPELEKRRRPPAALHRRRERGATDGIQGSNPHS
jgi:hypothetical protein